MNLNQTIEAARNVLRFKHMAIKTEKSYVHWIRRFAFWYRRRRAAARQRRIPDLMRCARITIGRYDTAADAQKACQGHSDAMQGDANTCVPDTKKNTPAV